MERTAESADPGLRPSDNGRSGDRHGRIPLVPRPRRRRPSPQHEPSTAWRTHCRWSLPYLPQWHMPWLSALPSPEGDLKPHSHQVAAKRSSLVALLTGKRAAGRERQRLEHRPLPIGQVHPCGHRSARPAGCRSLWSKAPRAGMLRHAAAPCRARGIPDRIRHGGGATS
jgi:hypothetical protein